GSIGQVVEFTMLVAIDSKDSVGARFKKLPYVRRCTPLKDPSQSYNNNGDHEDTDEQEDDEEGTKGWCLLQSDMTELN
ncbi:hypothetical protein BGX21_005227, partial [Mortierella sp. AD011]